MPIATSTTAVIAYKYHDYTTTMVCATKNNCSSVIMVLYLYHIYDKITVVKRFFSVAKTIVVCVIVVNIFTGGRYTRIPLQYFCYRDLYILILLVHSKLDQRSNHKAAMPLQREILNFSYDSTCSSI